MSKYGKEDIWVIASDGTLVLREMLDYYEEQLMRRLIESEVDDFLDHPEKFNKLQENTDFGTDLD